MRLQKILAQAGLASRREAENWIRAGRVAVNGEVARVGDSADPVNDRITVDGESITRESPTYWLLNKPTGVISTCSDPQGRRTVLDLLPRAGRSARLFPVGRLDLDSEGLLLLTNDGEVAQALLHPSLESPRIYEVWVRGEFGAKESRAFLEGIPLAEGRAAPVTVEKTGPGLSPEERWLRLRLGEGRKRQIRRSMEAVGCRVVRLQRVAMGPLELAGLASGESRRLSPEEADSLRRYARQRYRQKFDASSDT